MNDTDKRSQDHVHCGQVSDQVSLLWADDKQELQPEERGQVQGLCYWGGAIKSAAGTDD